jgi:hypothetical protein
MIKKNLCARSEKDITRVSGTLGPSSILGGRTILNLLENLTNLRQAENSRVAYRVA